MKLLTLIKVMLNKKIIFELMHDFMISICETVSQFNCNLMTQFDEGKRYIGIRTIKIFEFENIRRDIKKCCSHLEKNKAICQTRHTNQGYLPTKVTPAIDFTDKTVIWCTVPVVENTFVDDFKRMIKMVTIIIDTNYCKQSFI